MTEFVRVIPAEVQRFGAAAAIVLAHIRFRCAAAGTAARTWQLEREGHMWWRVTHRELAGEVGLSEKAVRNALRALESVVAAKHYPPLSDQSRAYRIAESSGPLTSQSPERADADQPVAQKGIPDSQKGICSRPEGHLQSPERASVLPMKKLKKREEAPPLTEPPTCGPYGPRCRKHANVEYPESCGGCRAASDTYNAAMAAYEASENNRRRAIREQIDNCKHCDQYGRLDDLEDCPKHPNLRKPAAEQRVAM